MLHPKPVVTYVEELTLVVVSREGTLREGTLRDEPHFGGQPHDDASQVFAQGPSESAFSFDLRLRECLENPSLLRSMAKAVLVCTADLGDREILRRLRLVAARVKAGGNLTLSYDPTGEQTPAFAQRLTRLAEFASAALAAQCVKITALPMSKFAEESAPLSAAWQRLQRYRSGVCNSATTQGPTHSAEPSSHGPRDVFTQTIVRQRKTHTTVHAADWPPAQPPMPALILPR